MSRDMANRQFIITNINWAKQTLEVALKDLKKENSDGDTFNFLNAPKLDTAFNELCDVVNNIKAYVYSEDGNES